jgi:hypothetical protein
VIILDFFNSNDGAGQGHASEDDNMSVLSHMMYVHEDVGVNTSSILQSTPETNNVNEVLSTISDVLKDVVNELRSLKQFLMSIFRIEIKLMK